MTLEKIAESLKITASKGKVIEGLKYYYYNAKQSTKPAIVAYYKNEHRYTYLDAGDFMCDHGLDSLDDLINL